MVESDAAVVPAVFRSDVLFEGVRRELKATGLRVVRVGSGEIAEWSEGSVVLVEVAPDGAVVGRDLRRPRSFELIGVASRHPGSFRSTASDTGALARLFFYPVDHERLVRTVLRSWVGALEKRLRQACRKAGLPMVVQGAIGAILKLRPMGWPSGDRDRGGGRKGPVPARSVGWHPMQAARPITSRGRPDRWASI